VRSKKGAAPPAFKPPPPPPTWARALRTVGVTGTNGKTTTTTFVAAALASSGTPVVRVTTVGIFLREGEGAGETKLDVPATHEGFLHALDHARKRGARSAAIEYTSEALARGFARSWPIEVAAFTNLTHDHLDAHGSPEHYLASKAQLFVSLPSDGTAVLNGCDDACALIAEVVAKGARVLRYGVRSRGAAHATLDVEATKVTPTWSGTEIEIASSMDAVPKSLRVRAVGEIFAENALAALLASVAFDVRGEDAARAIGACDPPPGRFQVVAERPWIVVDYAHSPDALERTLATAKRLCTGALTVVFGAGGNRDRDKRKPMGEAARVADRVVLTSDNPRGEDPAAIAKAIRAGLEGHRAVEVELDRGKAIERAVREAARDDVVLVAGKGHETEQKIGDVVKPFSDVDVALAAWRGR
jgi:UDP-N-acetylmuramoyl-L-alanyl-D-glutamate--2,6-diaminopimelate ligase